MVEFGFRIGDLDLPDWDQAVFRAIGGQLDVSKNQWYLPLEDIVAKVPGQPDQAVPRALIVMKRPEATTTDYLLPEITVIRDSVIPARNRLVSAGCTQYRLPAPGARRVSAGGKLGWDRYEIKPKAEPFDISYTIECWTRSRALSQILMQLVMANFPQMGTMKVIDSIGNEGIYAVYQQSSADLTQLGSMVDRVPAFSVSIKIEAELTQKQRSFTVAAFTGATSDHPVAGLNDKDPNPGPGGLYGTGLPIIRAGLVEDI